MGANSSMSQDLKGGITTLNSIESTITNSMKLMFNLEVRIPSFT